jgi:hypothetical protein
MQESDGVEEQTDIHPLQEFFLRLTITVAECSYMSTDTPTTLRQKNCNAMKRPTGILPVGLFVRLSGSAFAKTGISQTHRVSGSYERASSNRPR